VALLTGILLAIFVLDSPWDVVAVALGAIWDLADVVFWFRWSRRRRARVGAETLVGRTARVTRACTPEGQVQVDGELWRARCADAEGAQAGETVRILALDGLTLIVERES